MFLVDFAEVLGLEHVCVGVGVNGPLTLRAHIVVFHVLGRGEVGVELKGRLGGVGLGLSVPICNLMQH